MCPRRLDPACIVGLWPSGLRSLTGAWLQSSIAVFLFFDYVGDLIFWLDIILLFFTPFNEEGFFVTDPKVIV